VCVCNVCVKCVCVCVCVCEREFVVSIFFHKHRKPVSWGLLARASARTRARKAFQAREVPDTTWPSVSKVSTCSRRSPSRIKLALESRGDTDLGLVFLLPALAEYALRATVPPKPSLMLLLLLVLLLLGPEARPRLLLASTNPSSNGCPGVRK
jgi:hypothetical protein